MFGYFLLLIKLFFLYILSFFYYSKPKNIDDFLLKNNFSPLFSNDFKRKENNE